MVIAQPPDRLACLRHLVASWLGRRFGSCSDLDSLLGHLSHESVVVKPGRIFLWQLFSLIVRNLEWNYFAHLDSIARTTLAWWDCFL